MLNKAELFDNMQVC